MTPTKRHHARIMIECGCSIEDVCVSLGLGLIDAIYAVAPALDHNPDLRKRVRYMLGERGLPQPNIPVIHKGRQHVDSGNVVQMTRRKSA